MPTKLPIKHLVFVQDSNEEEGEDTKMEEKAPRDKEIEIRTKEAEGDRESPKGKSIMPKWLER